MTVAESNMRQAGIRKAAIFVASLDRAAADRLLDQLDAESADLVRHMAMALDQINDDERQRVIDEFRRIRPMVPDQSPPGIELDSPMAEQTGRTRLAGVDDNLPSPAGRGAGGEGVNVENGLQAACPPDHNALTLALSQRERGPLAPASPDDPPFGFLREAEQERLSQLLVGERPQTIALVLSHLPPERAGAVLAGFASPLQVEVVRRLADLENTDPETLREVEQALEARLSRQFAIERGRVAGPEAVNRILASCDAQVVRSILDNLASFDEALAERISRGDSRLAA